MTPTGRKVFTSTDSNRGIPDYPNRSGQIVEVIRPLTADECDIDEVGPMYRIRFADGVEGSAFADELSEIPSEAGACQSDQRQSDQRDPDHPAFVAFLDSDVFGYESFEHDTFDEAIAAMRRLYESAVQRFENDGIRRRVGILIQ